MKAVQSLHMMRIMAPVFVASLFPSMGLLAAESADQQTMQAILQRLERLEQHMDSGSEKGENLTPPEITVPLAESPLAELSQRLAVLERKLEIAGEEAAAKAAATPTVSIGEKGLSLKNAETGFRLKLRGIIQFDQRNFYDDDQVQLNDTHLLRRIRPSLEGTLTPLIAYRLTPEFAGDSARIIDAYIDLRFNPAYTLRVGKITGPVGLERLQSGSALSMAERGFPSELAPNRDIGAQWQGELLAGRLNYAFGLFNGTPDGRDATTTDSDNNFEWAARIFAEPWRNDGSAFSGLGFGVAVSTGDKQGAGNNFLPRYRTPGQNVFFNYRSSVEAVGKHQRISPQLYFYRNAYGVLAEYIRSAQELSSGRTAARQRTLENDAWQLTTSWILTGENASFRGVDKPNQAFALGDEGWGAFELLARYGELDIDDAAFPLYADPQTAASRARAWGLGLNWYLTSNLKLVFNHTHARFDGGARASKDRPDEKGVFSRIQVAF